MIYKIIRGIIFSYYFSVGFIWGLKKAYRANKKKNAE